MMLGPNLMKCVDGWSNFDEIYCVLCYDCWSKFDENDQIITVTGLMIPGINKFKKICFNSRSFGISNSIL